MKSKEYVNDAEEQVTARVLHLAANEVFVSGMSAGESDVLAEMAEEHGGKFKRTGPTTATVVF